MGGLETVMDNGTVTVDQSKYKKLEMPMFVGENPKSWVYKTVTFFFRLMTYQNPISLR